MKGASLLAFPVAFDTRNWPADVPIGKQVGGVNPGVMVEFNALPKEERVGLLLKSARIHSLNSLRPALPSSLPVVVPSMRLTPSIEYDTLLPALESDVHVPTPTVYRHDFDACVRDFRPLPYSTDALLALAIQHPALWHRIQESGLLPPPGVELSYLAQKYFPLAAIRGQVAIVAALAPQIADIRVIRKALRSSSPAVVSSILQHLRPAILEMLPVKRWNTRVLGPVGEEEISGVATHIVNGDIASEALLVRAVLLEVAAGSDGHIWQADSHFRVPLDKSLRRRHYRAAQLIIDVLNTSTHPDYVSPFQASEKLWETVVTFLLSGSSAAHPMLRRSLLLATDASGNSVLHYLAHKGYFDLLRRVSPSRLDHLNAFGDTLLDTATFASPHVGTLERVLELPSAVTVHDWTRELFKTCTTRSALSRPVFMRHLVKFAPSKTWMAWALFLADPSDRHHNCSLDIFRIVAETGDSTFFDQHPLTSFVMADLSLTRASTMQALKYLLRPEVLPLFRTDDRLALLEVAMRLNPAHLPHGRPWRYLTLDHVDIPGSANANFAQTRAQIIRRSVFGRSALPQLSSLRATAKYHIVFSVLALHWGAICFAVLLMLVPNQLVDRRDALNLAPPPPFQKKLAAVIHTVGRFLLFPVIRPRVRAYHTSSLRHLIESAAIAGTNIVAFLLLCVRIGRLASQFGLPLLIASADVPLRNLLPYALHQHCLTLTLSLGILVFIFMSEYRVAIYGMDHVTSYWIRPKYKGATSLSYASRTEQSHLWAVHFLIYALYITLTAVIPDAVLLVFPELFLARLKTARVLVKPMVATSMERYPALYAAIRVAFTATDAVLAVEIMKPLIHLWFAGRKRLWLAQADEKERHTLTSLRSEAEIEAVFDRQHEKLKWAAVQSSRSGEYFTAIVMVLLLGLMAQPFPTFCSNEAMGVLTLAILALTLKDYWKTDKLDAIVVAQFQPRQVLLPKLSRLYPEDTADHMLFLYRSLQPLGQPESCLLTLGIVALFTTASFMVRVI
ncbi:MAG: hypothetical protein KVP17_001030, partial [Porospora cf. gigantea B]